MDATTRYGLRGDGVTDNTARFTEMFKAAGQSLCVKQGTYVTSKQTLPANTYLYLEPGTVIQDAGVLAAGERLFSILDVSNVYIQGYGARLVMNRADYTSGEQRHGVMIRGGINVTIEGLESSSTGGDGFYIGRGPINGPSANVVLRDVSADNNRRQGLSIVSGRDIQVIHSRFTNTNGTSPQAGIDVSYDNERGPGG